MKEYSIAVIPGDGIGPEVIAEGVKVLDAAATSHRFRIQWKYYPYGADHYLKTGELLSSEALTQLSQHHAILFGACGDERVAPGILEKGLVIAIRMHFDQFVNLRPVKLLRGIESALRDKGPSDIDFVVVRENTEDFYVAAGGRVLDPKAHHSVAIKRRLFDSRFSIDIEHTAEGLAYQLGLITAEGSRRIFRYGFELAKRRRRHLTLVDKANVLTDMYSYWRELFEEVSKEYPDVETEYLLVDAACMWFIRNPKMFDVVVAPNMFGDILTDLGAAIQGGLGTSPGANINPAGISMFEPIHGSAPPLRGLQQANPIATIWSGALMLENLGEESAAKTVLRAIEESLSGRGKRTSDLKGTNSTSDVGDFIANAVTASRRQGA